MTPVEFRILTPDDAAVYWNFRLEALEREPEAFNSSPDDHRKLSKDNIRSRLAVDLAEHFVVSAFDDGKLVGTAGFVRQPGVKERHKGRIWGVYLKAEMRGKGIGRSMMKGLLERAAAIEGLEQILLSVTTTQPLPSRCIVRWGSSHSAVRPRR
jgi:ribosomal protein S18 acetylase RimI-like enzyme